MEKRSVRLRCRDSTCSNILLQSARTTLPPPIVFSFPRISIALGEHHRCSVRLPACVGLLSPREAINTTRAQPTVIFLSLGCSRLACSILPTFRANCKHGRRCLLVSKHTHADQRHYTSHTHHATRPPTTNVHCMIVYRLYLRYCIVPAV